MCLGLNYEICRICFMPKANTLRCFTVVFFIKRPFCFLSDGGIILDQSRICNQRKEARLLFHFLNQ